MTRKEKQQKTGPEREAAMQDRVSSRAGRTLDAAVRRYSRAAMVLALVLGAGCMAAGWKAVGKGIVLGALFSVLNFVLMARGLPARLAPTRKAAAGRSFISIILRFAFMAAPLYVGIKFESVNFFAVAVGLFAVQLAILAEHVFAAFSR